MRIVDRIRAVDAPRLSPPWAARTARFFCRDTWKVPPNKSVRIGILAAAVSCVLNGSGQAGRRPALRLASWLKDPVPAAQGPATSGPGEPSAAGPQQQAREHLPEWFRQHENLSLPEQARALQSEPGFARLPFRKQQRLLRRLEQLDAMPPRRRERTLERMEALEKLSPEQRFQVRSVMQQVTQMPEQKRRRLRKAFRNLTQLSPSQRQTVLNSPGFQAEFSASERQMLGTLLSVQPYHPEPCDAGPQYGTEQLQK